MEGAYVNVRVICATDLQKLMSSPAAMFVAVRCEGRRSETQESLATFEPIWNEVFNFKIKRGDDPLDISLCTKDFLQRINVYGRVILNLEQYKN
jgi:Ca2+-dependent lipid-binding protein